MQTEEPWLKPRWMTEYTEQEWQQIANLRCPAGMVAVPGGEVYSEWKLEFPRQERVRGAARQVSAFCMDRFEYPNKRYVVPRVNVSWADAVRLCDEAGKRLCREDEWELACTMGREWAYSYGPDKETYRCNSDHPVGNMEAIAPVGSRIECRNRYGIFDLNGNVSEWVAQTDSNLGGTNGVVRGGTAWTTDEYGGSCWSRHAHPVNDAQYGDDGFRCCLDPR